MYHYIRVSFKRDQLVLFQYLCNIQVIVQKVVQEYVYLYILYTSIEVYKGICLYLQHTLQVVQCTVYNISTTYTERRTLYAVHCTSYSVQGIYNVRRTLQPEQCTDQIYVFEYRAGFGTLYTIQCICIVYVKHLDVYSASYALP